MKKVIGREAGQAGLGGGEGDVREYNTLNLPRFSRDLDRYKVSNRAGAKLGNALLKDLGVVTEENLELLLCPHKIMRQRAKFGTLSAWISLNWRFWKSMVLLFTCHPILATHLMWKGWCLWSQSQLSRG